MTREQEQQVFELFTPTQMAEVAAAAATVDETHQVARLSMLLFGMTPRKPVNQRTPRDAAIIKLYEQINTTRRRLEAAALTDEQRAQNARIREAEAFDRARAQEAQRRGYSRDRALDRLNRGSYLAPHERDALAKGA